MPTVTPPSPSPLTADHVRHLDATLPPWRADLDDDPRWLLPTTAVGLAPLTLAPAVLDAWLRRARTAANQARTLTPPVEIPLAEVRWTTQTWLRVDTLAHYLARPQHPVHLFDPDGWFDTDLPVLCTLPDLPDSAEGLAVLDGNNRTAAARLRGDLTLTAHLVDPARLA